MTATFILFLALLHACQADSGHWELQIQLYGTNTTVVLNQTRWDTCQFNMYLYPVACSIQIYSPGRDTHSHFTECGGLRWEGVLKQ